MALPQLLQIPHEIGIVRVVLEDEGEIGLGGGVGSEALLHSHQVLFTSAGNEVSRLRYGFAHAGRRNDHVWRGLDVELDDAGWGGVTIRVGHGGMC